MKILYGVQGTGNGHISRAREMAKAFADHGSAEVTYLFSGRERAGFFDMDVFGDFRLMTGLSFHVDNGHVSYVKTALKTRPLNFVKEVKSLDLSPYDLVISDFEPVTAWAAKLGNKPVLGIGHQYAFNHAIPREGIDFLAAGVMKWFAPLDRSIGLHWHHFGQPIMPPIITTEPPDSNPRIENKIIVYLPFENPQAVVELLAPFRGHRFILYCPVPAVSTADHIEIKPLSRTGFLNDLLDCSGILCNAGFELVSEALYLGKKILVKPLHSQAEQISNAAALKQLGYGQVMHDLDANRVVRWLRSSNRIQVTYPNVAKILVRWILKGMPPLDDEMIEKSWSTVNVIRFNE